MNRNPIHQDGIEMLRTDLGPYWPLKILGMGIAGLGMLLVIIYLFALLEASLWL